MKRLALLLSLVTSSVGFWLGHQGRPPLQPIVVRLPPPPAEPEEAPVMKKGRAAVIDVRARTPWVKKGDHIDVLGVLPDPQTNEQVAVTMVQNVVVLGTQKLEGDRQRLSLLVIPEEADLLLLVARIGELDVTLRNPDDVDVIEERGRTTVNTVLSGERYRLLENKRRTQVCTLLRGKAP